MKEPRLTGSDQAPMRDAHVGVTCIPHPPHLPPAVGRAFRFCPSIFSRTRDRARRAKSPTTDRRVR